MAGRGGLGQASTHIQPYDTYIPVADMGKKKMGWHSEATGAGSVFVMEAIG